MRSVCIIGGGYCGAMTALHLLRDFPNLALRIDVVEPRPILGAGLAYSTPDPEHRINVAAARMSPFVEDDAHFDRWLREAGEAVNDPAALLSDGRLYVQRAAVGRYVGAALRDAAVAAQMTLRHHERRAVDARRLPDGRWGVTLDDGATLVAHVLVLATGHPPPRLPAALRPLTGDARLIADPWDAAALDSIARDARVLIVGTGLTAHDVVASLRARGHCGALLAVSRRGLLSRPRTDLPVEPIGDFSTAPATTARTLLRRVRNEVAACAAAGQPWECVIDALRRQGTAVWGALPPAERHRLLRHLRPFWDVHRFQLAPQVARVVAAEIARGALRVMAASLHEAHAEPDGIAVRLHPRATPDGTFVADRFDTVVVCTGPGHGDTVTGDALPRSLLAQGLLRADVYGLGIDVDLRSRCRDAAGHPVADLFVAGPPARGTFGELMGLPQVSTQPRAVAAEVAAWIAAIAGCGPATIATS